MSVFMNDNLAIFSIVYATIAEDERKRWNQRSGVIFGPTVRMHRDPAIEN